MNFFDLWNGVKKKIHASKNFPHVKKGEIRWIQFGKNIGSKSFGKGDQFQRPGLILQSVFGNASVVIPLTKKNIPQ